MGEELGYVVAAAVAERGGVFATQLLRRQDLYFCTSEESKLCTWPARCPTSQRLRLMPTCCLCLIPYAYLLIRAAYLARSLPDVATSLPYAYLLSLPYTLCLLADTLCLPGPLVARRRVQVLFRGGPLAAPSASVFVLLY